MGLSTFMLVRFSCLGFALLATANLGDAKLCWIWHPHSPGGACGRYAVSMMTHDTRIISKRGRSIASSGQRCGTALARLSGAHASSACYLRPTLPSPHTPAPHFPALQGGIHPDFTGETYLALLDAAKRGAPQAHIHAFSPLEVHQGATTLGLPVKEYLRLLKQRGLGSLPGTAAEVLDPEVRS